MRRYQPIRSIGCLLLAAALSISGCSREDGSSVPGQIAGGDWGETPPAYETVPAYPSESAAVTTGAASATETVSTTGSAPAGTASTGGASSTGSGRPPTGATTTTSKTTAATSPPAPLISGELRGVWVSHYEMEKLLKGATEEQAKAALDKLMDNCVSYGMNAVILHVRANSDAYYQSAIFQPVASVRALIAGGFDPLAYAVTAAHKRGLQLHAWVNPYRIGLDEGNAVGDANCRFWKYRNGQYQQKSWYYIPTSTAAQKIILDGVREIVRGYDVDGVHFDDYFYPNDTDSQVGINHKQPESFEAEFNTKGGQTLGDWRRAAVDALVSQAYAIVHQKKNCVFGISPSHNMERARETEYADTAKWLAQRGYVDYLCPQVYFGFEHNSSAFDTCTKEWLAMPRASAVKLLIGVGIYKTGIPDDEWANHSLPAGTGARAEWATHDDIMKRQVEFLRSQSGVGGMLFYSYSFFDPATKGELTGENLKTAQREVDNLLPLLKK